MIKNLWKQTAFLCGNHTKPVLMEPFQGPHSIFYRCPDYVKKYQGEKGCPNRISPENAEGILQALSDHMEQHSRMGVDINLTGYQFQYKFIKCKIVLYDNDKILISVINQSAIRKK